MARGGKHVYSQDAELKVPDVNTVIGPRRDPANYRRLISDKGRSDLLAQSLGIPQSDHPNDERYDYVSPGWVVPSPWAAFPHARVGAPRGLYVDGVMFPDPHRWFYDRRYGPCGFVNTDEAAILYRYAELFRGKRALEIGCHLGFSAWHLCAGGVELAICDPALHNPEQRAHVAQSLQHDEFDCAVLGIGSPDAVYEMAGEPWSLAFIDGDHNPPRPAVDALVASHFCAEDAAILFHDGHAAAVMNAVALLRAMGWKSRIYRTSQVVIACWRGNVAPIDHTSDPAIVLPPYLADLDGKGS